MVIILNRRWFRNRVETIYRWVITHCLEAKNSTLAINTICLSAIMIAKGSYVDQEGAKLQQTTKEAPIAICNLFYRELFMELVVF